MTNNTELTSVEGHDIPIDGKRFHWGKGLYLESVAYTCVQHGEEKKKNNRKTVKKKRTQRRRRKTGEKYLQPLQGLGTRQSNVALPRLKHVLEVNCHFIQS